MIDPIVPRPPTGDAIKLSFARYWILMLLPTVVAIAATLAMILVVFVYFPTRGHCMPRHFTTLVPGDAPPAPSVEGGGERDGGMLELTTPPSSMMAMIADQPGAAEEENDDEEEPRPPDTPSKASLMTAAPKVRYLKVAVFGAVLLLLSISNFIRAELWAISFIASLFMLGIDLAIVHVDGHSKYSFLSRIYSRLPLPIAPFVLSMFLL